jgi:hypothetical protein
MLYIVQAVSSADKLVNVVLHVMILMSLWLVYALAKLKDSYTQLCLFELLASLIPG